MAAQTNCRIASQKSQLFIRLKSREIRRKNHIKTLVTIEIIYGGLAQSCAKIFNTYWQDFFVLLWFNLRQRFSWNVEFNLCVNSTTMCSIRCPERKRTNIHSSVHLSLSNVTFDVLSERSLFFFYFLFRLVTFSCIVILARHACLL